MANDNLIKNITKRSLLDALLILFGAFVSILLLRFLVDLTSDFEYLYKVLAIVFWLLLVLVTIIFFARRRFKKTLEFIVESKSDKNKE